ncbi:hypothetical protein [Wolbachia endosymbiont (group A) of Myopa testacea]|uniref:hypothetical protein n=1 Tax=Wolbachia endosymbiont (group A) of Myopa testacea TaxID=3066148 RepID=UPI00313331AD
MIVILEEVFLGCPPSDPNRPAPIPRGPYTKAAHAVVNMAELHYADKFSRFAGFNPIGNDSNYYRICLPECPSEEEKYGYDCTLGSGASGGMQPTVIDPKGMFHCENAMVIVHAGRVRNAVRKNTDGRVFFDLNLVSSGKIYGSSKWENEFVIREGTIEVYGGNGTVNIFTLVDSGFRGRIFGGNNATNIINVSHLERDIQYDSENGVLFNIIMKKINYLIGSKKKSETVNCSQDDMVVDSRGAEHGLDYINDCR